MKVMLILCFVALAVVVGTAYVQSGRTSFFFTTTYAPSSADILRGR